MPMANATQIPTARTSAIVRRWRRTNLPTRWDQLERRPRTTSPARDRFKASIRSSVGIGSQRLQYDAVEIAAKLSREDGILPAGRATQSRLAGKHRGFFGDSLADLRPGEIRMIERHTARQRLIKNH